MPALKVLFKSQRALLERLSWAVAERNDSRVAQAVADREETDEIHYLDLRVCSQQLLELINEIATKAGSKVNSGNGLQVHSDISGHIMLVTTRTSPTTPS